MQHVLTGIAHIAQTFLKCVPVDCTVDMGDEYNIFFVERKCMYLFRDCVFRELLQILELKEQEGAELRRKIANLNLEISSLNQLIDAQKRSELENRTKMINLEVKIRHKNSVNLEIWNESENTLLQSENRAFSSKIELLESQLGAMKNSNEDLLERVRNGEKLQREQHNQIVDLKVS